MLFKLGRNLARFGVRFTHECYQKPTYNKHAIESSVSELARDENQNNVRENEFKKESRLLKVALLGLPNAGKSSIINRLVTRTVCPVSVKVHTTQHNADAIYTEGNTQIVFIDTPGVLRQQDLEKYNSKNNYGIVKTALKQANLIGLIQDVGDIYNRHTIQEYVLKLVRDIGTKVPLILIFNKVDKIKKKKMLLQLTKTMVTNRELPRFKDIFMISALHGDGINDLRDYLIDSAQPKDWEYAEDIYTNQEPKVIIEETVRAKLLDALPQEIPYNLEVRLEHIGTRSDGSMVCIVEITCKTVRLVHLIVKNGGKKIKTIARMVEEELRQGFQTSVAVRLQVRSIEKDKETPT